MVVSVPEGVILKMVPGSTAPSARCFLGKSRPVKIAVGGQHIGGRLRITAIGAGKSMQGGKEPVGVIR